MQTTSLCHRILETSTVIIERQPLGPGQDDHQTIANETSGDTRGNNGQPKHPRKPRFSVVGDIGLLHCPASGWDSVLN